MPIHIHVHVLKVILFVFLRNGNPAMSLLQFFSFDHKENVGVTDKLNNVQSSECF